MLAVNEVVDGPCQKCRRLRSKHKQLAHSFVANAQLSNPDILVSCPCGMACKLIEKADPVLYPDIIQDMGWRIIKDVWRCPSCGRRAQRAAEKRVDPRQGSYL
jgi:rubredoxin